MIRFNKKKKHGFVIFSNFIRKICKGDRLNRISIEITNILRAIHLNNKKKIRILDFGCGSMELSRRIQSNNFIKEIIGIDTFSHKFAKKKLRYMDFEKFEKYKNKKFEAIIIVDVLHHIGIDDAFKTLKKLSKYSKKIIIKDHFEHGFFSRQLLRFIDFYGNYGHGVTIPKKYFDNTSWKKTVKKTNLKQTKLIKNFQQHDGIFNVILNKRHHFISVLKK